jgi:hypothetical protein
MRFSIGNQCNSFRTDVVRLNLPYQTVTAWLALTTVTICWLAHTSEWRVTVVKFGAYDAAGYDFSNIEHLTT